MVVRLPHVVRRTENLLGLLDGILHLTGDKKRCQGDILVVVLGAREADAKLVVVDCGRAEGPDWSTPRNWSASGNPD